MPGCLPALFQKRIPQLSWQIRNSPADSEGSGIHQRAVDRYQIIALSREEAVFFSIFLIQPGDFSSVFFIQLSDFFSVFFIFFG